MFPYLFEFVLMYLTDGVVVGVSVFVGVLVGVAVLVGVELIVAVGVGVCDDVAV